MSETTTPSELAQEAQHGQSERTPAIALTGVFIVVSSIVAVIAGIALVLYYAV
jgi:hypothetical protein